MPTYMEQGKVLCHYIILICPVNFLLGIQEFHVTFVTILVLGLAL